MYNMGKEKRKKNGKLGREYMMKNFSSKVMCDSFVKGIEETLKKWKPRNKFDLYKIV